MKKGIIPDAFDQLRFLLIMLQDDKFLHSH